MKTLSKFLMVSIVTIVMIVTNVSILQASQSEGYISQQQREMFIRQLGDDVAQHFLHWDDVFDGEFLPWFFQLIYEVVYVYEEETLEGMIEYLNEMDYEIFAQDFEWIIWEFMMDTDVDFDIMLEIFDLVPDREKINSIILSVMQEYYETYAIYLPEFLAEANMDLEDFGDIIEFYLHTEWGFFPFDRDEMYEYIYFLVEDLLFEFRINPEEAVLLLQILHLFVDFEEQFGMDFLWSLFDSWIIDDIIDFIELENLMRLLQREDLTDIIANEHRVFVLSNIFWELWSVWELEDFLEVDIVTGYEDLSYDEAYAHLISLIFDNVESINYFLDYDALDRLEYFIEYVLPNLWNDGWDDNWNHGWFTDDYFNYVFEELFLDETRLEERIRLDFEDLHEMGKIIQVDYTDARLNIFFHNQHEFNSFWFFVESFDFCSDTGRYVIFAEGLLSPGEMFTIQLPLWEDEMMHHLFVTLFSFEGSVSGEFATRLTMHPLS